MMRKCSLFLILLASCLLFSLTSICYAANPNIKSFSGSVWSYTCPSSYNGYLRVGYNKNGDSVTKITANGSDLDKVTSISLSDSNFSGTINNKSKTSLTLTILARFGAPDPKPTKSLKVTYYYSGGSKSATITQGVIPTFNAGGQSWGQCTWWAWYQRVIHGKTPVKSYGGVSINGDPNSKGFPKTNSVLMVNKQHMAYALSTNQTSVKTTSTTITTTYTIKVTQYNSKCTAQQDDYNTTMIVEYNKKQKKYKIIQYPQSIWKNITHVAQ